jgi:diguanylate cyclase (GGDEF)-like protein/PAS domain S-box-containing protein
MTSLSRHVLEQVVTFGREPILIADAQAPGLPIVYVNPAFERQSGYAAAELVGRAWSLLEREATDSGLQRLKAAIGRGETASAVVVDFNRAGRAWRSEITVAPLYQGPGDLRYLLFQQRPAVAGAATAERSDSALERELRRAELKIASLGQQDPATGLLRWEYFLEQAERDYRMAQRDSRNLAVLVFEVLELDAYRATFGTKAAESCLRMIAAQVAGSLKRAGDLTARQDERRIVALVHGHDYERAFALAARIRDNVRGLGLHNPRGTTSRFVEVAIGVAVGVPDQASANGCEGLLAAARASMSSHPPARTEPLTSEAGAAAVALQRG